MYNRIRDGYELDYYEQNKQHFRDVFCKVQSGEDIVVDRDHMRQMTDEEREKILQDIIDGIYNGHIDLGKDPERLRELLKKYGWEGFNMIWDSAKIEE